MHYAQGYIENPKDERDFIYTEVFGDLDEGLPDYVDYEHSMPPVRHQYGKGACVAFACCAVLEWQRKHSGAIWYTDVDLSEDMLYHMIAEPGGGAFPRNAMKSLQKVGTSREKFWPYDNVEANPKGSRYVINWREHRRALGDSRKFRIGEYAILDSFNAMKTALAKTGPIVIGQKWASTWGNTDKCKKKIHHRPLLQPIGGMFKGGHMVCICGYTVINGETYYKVRNSWGARWGAMGYAYISEEALTAGDFRAWAIYNRIHG